MVSAQCFGARALIASQGKNVMGPGKLTAGRSGRRLWLKSREEG